MKQFLFYYTGKRQWFNEALSLPAHKFAEIEEIIGPLDGDQRDFICDLCGEYRARKRTYAELALKARQELIDELSAAKDLCSALSSWFKDDRDVAKLVRKELILRGLKRTEGPVITSATPVAFALAGGLRNVSLSPLTETESALCRLSKQLDDFIEDVKWKRRRPPDDALRFFLMGLSLLVIECKGKKHLTCTDPTRLDTARGGFLARVARCLLEVWDEGHIELQTALDWVVRRMKKNPPD